MFTDKSGMFKDFGFKLLVIDSLKNGGDCSFSEELERMEEKYVDCYDGEPFVCIPEMVDYFENLKLTEEDLAKVTTLCFDGGNDIYFDIMDEWDGESDEFDVYSVEDHRLLPNLREVIYVSMCDKALMNDFPDSVTVK